MTPYTSEGSLVSELSSDEETSSINLYAESLLNLRQVTVFATLQSSQNVATGIQLSSDRKTLSLSHAGKHASIELPSDIDPDAEVAVPSSTADYFCLRLPVASIVQSCDQSDSIAPIEAPWSAASLRPGAHFCCRFCKSHVLGEQIKEWRDLPSEHWAEMMDFWHCHKPKDGAGSGAPLISRGYTAPEGFKAQSRVGYVDSCHMLASEDDSCALKVQQGRTSSVCCTSCLSPLGILDENIQGVRLYKWRLSLTSNTSAAWQEPQPQLFICARLLELIESQGTRRFMLYDGVLEEAAEALLLWVFTPDLRYSASSLPGGPRRGIKALYQVVDSPSDILAKHHSSLEELQIPKDLLREIRQNLESSNSIVPKSARTLQGWRVGLLNRFDSS